MKSTKNTESKNSDIARTKNGRRILLSKCAVCHSKFIKEQEARRLLSKLTGIKVPILSILTIAHIFFSIYKMNEVVNKLLLT